MQAKPVPVLIFLLDFDDAMGLRNHMQAMHVDQPRQARKNLEAHTLLRASQTPVVTVKVMPTDNEPGGIGEVGLPPLAPAVANAIAKLTGKRLRSLPFPETE